MKTLSTVLVKNKFGVGRVEELKRWAIKSLESSTYISFGQKPSEWLKGYDDVLQYIIDSCDEVLSYEREALP